MARPTASGLIAGLIAALLFGSAARAESWEPLAKDDDGITSWQREIPGSSFIAFRAQGRVEASLLTISAVLRDSSREKDWMEDCIASSMLAFLSPTHVKNYNRTKSPVFFISDRDVVLESDATVDRARQAVHITFHESTHPSAPEVEGVIRMPRLRGFWDLERISPSSTLVTYQVEADPGGALPGWLVNWASSSLSANTIRGLRRECKKGPGAADVAALTAALDWDTLGPVGTGTVAQGK